VAHMLRQQPHSSHIVLGCSGATGWSWQARTQRYDNRVRSLLSIDDFWKEEATRVPGGPLSYPPPAGLQRRALRQRTVSRYPQFIFKITLGSLMPHFLSQAHFLVRSAT
jgi:hypothetical protein